MIPFSSLFNLSQFEYRRMSLEMLRYKTLHVTIWDSDRFKENLFLGEVQIPLEKVDLGEKRENTQWYKLGNYSGRY